MKPKPDPIDNIQWEDADSLDANNYNPNVVHKPELDLLAFSLLSTGWIQPLLCNKRTGRPIIDGFHRWYLSLNDARIIKRWKKRVPVAWLDIAQADAIMLTVRINRAKGTHVALKMADIVKTLIETHHCAEEEIARGIGATLDEVRLLREDNLFKKRKLDAHQYSPAWIPKRTP